MSRKSEEDVRLCYHKDYLNGQYLSLNRKCEDCPHEVSDLFRGTSGKEVWLWFCMFDPVVVEEKLR